jgi:hypothetical protein
MIVHLALYHWVLLVYCILVAFIHGMVCIIGGSSPDSRFYAIDRIVVRVLGVGSVVFAVLVFLRESWAFYGLVCCLTFSLIDELIPFRQDVAASNLAARFPFAYMVFVTLILGVPIALLLWLRPVFTTN